MISKVLNRVRTAVGLTLVPGARTALVWNRFALEAVKRAHEDRAREARNAGVGLARLARRLKKAKEEATRLKKENDALIEALGWTSGSPSFQREGEARVGWLKICAPLLPGYVEANALEELAGHESAVEVVAIDEDVTRAPVDHAATYPPSIEYDLDEIDNGPVF